MSDADADGFSNQTLQYVGDTAPFGDADLYKRRQFFISYTSIDLNDSNQYTFQNLTCYVDKDGDGYTLGNGEQVASNSTCPALWDGTQSAGNDCDDDDALIC